MKDYSIQKKFQLLVYAIFTVALLGNCTNNDAQSEFEAQAYTLPFQNYTETDNSGRIVDGQIDDDDWRISPLYVGLANVNPVFPNPINLGSSFDLEIDINGAISSSMELWYISPVDGRPQFISSLQIVSDFELLTFRIDTDVFDTGGDQARTIHRLIVFDSNQRMVTYGDLLIQ